MAEIRKPDDLLLPEAQNRKDLDLYNSLQDYTKSLNDTFEDIADIQEITAGSGLTDATNTFNVNTDNSTIEINGSDNLAVKNGGIGTDQISATIAGLGLGISGATGALDVNVDDSTVEISTDTLQVKDLGIGSDQLAATSVITSKIFNEAVTTDKIADKNVTSGKLEDDLVFGTFPSTPSAAPDADYEVSNKKYVDDNSGAELGSWASATTGSSTQAASDSLIVVYATYSSGAAYIRIKTDSSNPPTTIRSQDEVENNPGATASVFSPVKSGDYYLIERENTNIDITAAYIIPIS